MQIPRHTLQTCHRYTAEIYCRFPADLLRILSRCPAEILQTLAADSYCRSPWTYCIYCSSRRLTADLQPMPSRHTLQTCCRYSIDAVLMPCRRTRPLPLTPWQPPRPCIPTWQPPCPLPHHSSLLARGLRRGRAALCRCVSALWLMPRPSWIAGSCITKAAYGSCSRGSSIVAPASVAVFLSNKRRCWS